MSNGYDETHDSHDLAPGDEYLEGGSLGERALGYVTGLGLAVL